MNSRETLNPKSPETALSTLVTKVGIYRLLCNINFNGSVPVNRDYLGDSQGDRYNPKLLDQRFKKSRMLCENPDLDCKYEEGHIDYIFTKPLLFLPEKNIVKINSPYECTYYNPEAALMVVDIRNQMDLVFGIGRVSVGLYGSQNTTLNHANSDFDFVITTDSEIRELVVKEFKYYVENIGFVSPDQLLHKHTRRYSKELEISEAAAAYLAKKRNRWVKNQIGLSLQCLTFSNLEDFFQDIFNSSKENYNITPITTCCKIIDSSDCFNRFKKWQLEINEQIITAFSFSHRHQGMGSEAKAGDTYSLRAYKIETPEGNYIFLKDENSYILPSNLINLN